MDSGGSADDSGAAPTDAGHDTTPEGHRVTVAVGGTGSGRVTSDPAGIDCPGDCEEWFATGTDLTLTPVADEGSRYDRWAGACRGQARAGGVVGLTIAGGGTCTAFFVPL